MSIRKQYNKLLDSTVDDFNEWHTCQMDGTCYKSTTDMLNAYSHKSGLPLSLVYSALGLKDTELLNTYDWHYFRDRFL